MYAAPYWGLEWLRKRAIDARRRDRTARYLAWTALAGVCSGCMLAIGATLVVALLAASLWWLALVIIAITIFPLLAGVLARYVLVPGGHHRLAYYAALASRPGTDGAAVSLCVAAWASRSGDAIVWVEAKRDARKPLGDGEIAATALLAANRGDAQTARDLLRSLRMIVENHAAVRELAGEWLACDAAERGAWPELLAEARSLGSPATPLAFLLEGIAAHHAGEPHAPPAAGLWARWLIAPRRGVTAKLVREALAASTARAASPTTAPPTEPTASDAPLQRAVAAQLAFETQPATAEALAATVAAWDAALADDATRTWLARRALELDASEGAVDRAIADVANAVIDELGRRAEAAQLGAPAGASGTVGYGLSHRLRHGRLDALEAGFDRWSQRRKASTPATGIDEWRAFVALWAAYDAAAHAGGLALRRLAFPHAFTRGSHMAAWLWNVREEFAVSHAISCWLLAEALIVGDAEAIELGHRNCGLAVPTKLGRIEATAPRSSSS